MTNLFLKLNEDGFVCKELNHRKFVNAANKVEILRHYKICIICLCRKFNAKAPKCRKQEYLCCDICKGKHETIMCGQDLRTLVEIKKAAERREEPIVFIPLEQQDAHVHNVTLSEIVVRSTTGGDHETTALTLNETEHSLSRTLLPTLIGEVLRADGTPVHARMFMDQIHGVYKNKYKRPRGTIPHLQGLGNPKNLFKMPSVHHPIDWKLDDRDWSDKKFNIPAKVQILLGSNVLAHLYTDGIERMGSYLLQNTRLGWAVSGGTDWKQNGAVKKVDLQTRGKKMVHRAVGRLEPLLPEKAGNDGKNTDATAEIADAVQVPMRRRPRVKASFAKNIALALMCLCTTAFGFEVTPLTPGLQVFKMGTVERQLATIEFTIKTKANMTKDFETVQKQIKEFNEFCDDEKKSELKAHCSKLGILLQEESAAAKTSIFGRFLKRDKANETRPKRQTGALIWKIVQKAAPHLITAGSLIALEVQHLQNLNKLEDMKKKVTTISTLLLNVTDTEYEAVEAQLNQLLEHQRELMAQVEMTDYATSLQVLLASVIQKCGSLSEIRPMNELHKYIELLNGEGTNFKLPETMSQDQIFTTYPVEQTLDNGQASLTFKIPLVRKELYEKYLIASIPKDDDEYFLLDYGFWQILAMDDKNRSYFEIPTQTDKYTQTVYEDTVITFKDTCATGAFLQQDAENRLCDKTKKFTRGNPFFLLGEDSAVIIVSKAEETKMECLNNKQMLAKGSFRVKYMDCTITSPGFRLEGRKQAEFGKQEEEDIQNMRPARETFEMTNPSEQQIKALREELKTQIKQLDSMSFESWIQADWVRITTGTILGVAAAGALTFIIWKKYHNPTQILSKDDLRMGSWADSIKKRSIFSSKQKPSEDSSV